MPLIHPGDYVWGDRFAIHYVEEVLEELIVLDNGRSVYQRQVRGVVRPGDRVCLYCIGGNWRPGIFQVAPYRVEFPNGGSVPLHSARYLRIENVNEPRISN